MYAIAEEYKPKQVLDVTRDEPGAGYVAKLECGHEMWFAVQVAAGEKRYCGKCIHELAKRLRAREVIA
jgi:hypothetical protein